MIKVSIIIPVYNTSLFLKDCLDSVFKQTYANFEVICINDGSTDNSLSILNSYSKIYSNLILIDQPNQGVSAARNAGLDKANGNFITFIDSDDYIDTSYLSNLVEGLNTKQYDLICSGLKDFDSDGIKNVVRLESNIFNLKEYNDIITFLETPLNTSPVAKLYRTDIIKKYHIRFKLGLSLGEDRDFNLRFFTKCNEILICNCVDYYYRKDVSASLTHLFHNDVLKNDYEAIKLKEQVLIEKDAINENTQRYISRLIVQLLFDSLISISRCKRKSQLFEEFRTVVDNIGINWNVLRLHSDLLKVCFIYKFLFFNKRFKSLLTLLSIKNTVTSHKQ